MILYFADRKMNILGQASTGLPDGNVIEDDVKTEEVDSGVVTFSCCIPYTDNTREKVERQTEAGNYLLRKNGSENEFYTIIESESDTETREVYIYAEDAGMDLLNEVLKSSGDGVPRSLKEYITDAVYDSGFEIGINESDDMEKIYYALDEQTASERILAMAERFGCEISYSFEIEQLTITHKYINIFRKRGKELGIQLTLHKDIDKITIKKTVANLATALLCTGANDTAGVAVSLDGYEYDDGDFYTDGHYLKSRKAVEKWSRYVWDKEPGRLAGQDGHIVKRFTYDTVSQEELCKQAVAELKKICDTEVNYEAEINRLPDGLQIGDTVNIVDDAGSLYLSARILKLETSVANDTKKATLGDYLIRKSGISEKVEELAGNFAEAMKARPLFTWTAYADDQNGTGISLSPDAKAYMGTAVNRTTEEPDLSDPSIFTWIKVKGDKGDKGDTGPQGNPTGITVSAAEPTSKFTGMLWKHTGTVSGLVSNATYRWNGSSWELYLFTAENISVNDLAALNATIGGWEIKPGKLQTTYDKNGASDENQIVHNYSTIVSFNTDSDKIINLILTDDVPDSGDGNAITSQVNTYINNLGSFVSRYINDANDPDGYYSEVINEPGMVRVTSHYDLDMETEISAGTVLITCDSDIVRLDYEGLNAPNGSVISNYIYANASYTIGTYEAIGKSGNCAVFGNNSAITRIATKTVSASNTGYSFGIGNGYQAALASSWEQNADIYLCGGQDSTSKFLRSYPIYARTYANAANVVVTGTGIIGRSTSSSIRYKHDVEYYSNAEHRVIDDDHVVSGQMDEDELLKVLDIPVVSFRYNDGYITGEADYDYDKPVVGFIADDVAAVCPECATYTDIDGEMVPESWDERQMIPRMLYVIQKQQKQIHDMKISHDAEMKKMEGKLSALEEEIKQMAKQIQTVKEV